MKRAIKPKQYTVVLEPFWKKGKAYIAIICPQDLWLYNHLIKLKGVSFDRTRRALTMSNSQMQIRSLQKHLKGLVLRFQNM